MVSACTGAPPGDFLFALEGVALSDETCNSGLETFESGVPPSGWTVDSLAVGPSWTDLASCIGPNTTACAVAAT